MARSRTEVSQGKWPTVEQRCLVEMARSIEHIGPGPPLRYKVGDESSLIDYRREFVRKFVSSENTM